MTARYRAGTPISKVERLAACELLKLAEDVPARTVVETTLAMVVLWELEPHAFVSDEAFWVQLARRVRALTDMNYGERYVHTTGRVKRTYRDLSLRASILMGRWLAETLGIGGLHIARLEKEEADRQSSERQKLHVALQELV
ncbi:hypothetical protein [Rhodomicrobium lacus]|uniref:hypothetical protein n=1 Tax=Rhodomicrobium lacus TaxID=2498452 RepID=UPI0013DEFE5C|nr:hypothetical protein [Rhodomicrobium lacus]